MPWQDSKIVLTDALLRRIPVSRSYRSSDPLRRSFSEASGLGSVVGARYKRLIAAGAIRTVVLEKGNSEPLTIAICFGYNQYGQKYGM